MRGFAGLLAYFVGVSAIISAGLISLMALQSPNERAPSALTVAAAASHKERLAKPIKQAIVAHKKARPNLRHKMARRTGKPTHAEATIIAGHEAYGYAEEPRRIDPHSVPIFGR